MTQKGFLKDKDWDRIDGKICLVKEFTPMFGATIKGGIIYAPNKSVPYASLELVYGRNFNEKNTGFVTHKLDFESLWNAFNHPYIKSKRGEVLMYWTRRHYASGATRLLSKLQPKMIVVICENDTHATLSNGFDLSDGEQIMINVHGLMPIEYFVPSVIK